MHIAVDCDDVLLDLTGGVRRVVEREYGVELPEFTDWNMNQWLEPVLGEKWMKFMRRRDWLWSTFPAIPGAIGTLTLLRREGHYLEMVTSKPEWAEASVFDWLAKWRPPIQRVTIVPPDGNKAEATNADLLIDDKPDNVIGWAATGRPALLFTRAHNAKLGWLPSNATRVEDWHHAHEEIARLASTDVVDS